MAKLARRPRVLGRADIRVIDRGAWFVVRLPSGSLDGPARLAVTQYLDNLPHLDRMQLWKLDAWCVKSEWIEPLIELLEEATGAPVLVET